MKTLKITMALCALFLLSCEIEDSSFQEEQELINVNLTARAMAPTSEWEDWNSDAFKNYLTDIVERIANTVSVDAVAAAEFEIIVQNNASFDISNTTVVIPLEEIFSDSSTYLYQAIETTAVPCAGRPIGGYGQPYPPLNDHLNSSYEMFIDNMLNDHCLELYLPFGFNSSSGLSGNSTEVIGIAHPLTNTNNLPPFTSFTAREFPIDLFAEGCEDSLNIYEHLTYSNLLILRLSPNSFVGANSYCQYPIYDTIDFTDFF